MRENVSLYGAYSPESEKGRKMSEIGQRKNCVEGYRQMEKKITPKGS